MNHEFVLAILASVLSSTGGWGVLQYVLGNKQKKKQADKDAKAEELERRRDQQAQDSQVWYRESRNHYDLAKEEAVEAKEEASVARAECNKCRQELEKTRGVVYMLLEDFEDQIIPMFTIPDTDPVEVRRATRSIIKRARDQLNAPR